MEAGANDMKCKNCGHSIIKEGDGSWLHKGGRKEQNRINGWILPNPEMMTRSCPVVGCKCQNPEPGPVDE